MQALAQLMRCQIEQASAYRSNAPFPGAPEAMLILSLDVPGADEVVLSWSTHELTPQHV